MKSIRFYKGTITEFPSMFELETQEKEGVQKIRHT